MEQIKKKPPGNTPGFCFLKDMFDWILLNVSIGLLGAVSEGLFDEGSWHYAEWE